MAERSIRLPIFQQFDENLSYQIVYYLNSLQQDYDDYFKESFEERGDEAVIKMVINSPGGYVTDLMAILDTMDNIELPVKTYCVGQAASCAAVLLSNGVKGERYIGKNSSVLLHQVSVGMMGNIQDVEIAMKEAKRVNEQIITILARNTKKSKSELRELMSRDLILNAKEAVEFGIVDKILEDGSKEMKFFNDVTTKKQDVEVKSAVMERKSIDFEIKNAQEDDDYFYFEGHASTFNDVDQAGDVMVKGSFKRTLKDFSPTGTQNERAVLWQHDMGNVIGKATLKEDDTGLHFMAKLPKEDSFVSGRVIPQLKNGSISTMSFGFRTLEKHYKEQKRYITDVELFEISVVTIPCNMNAKITSQKSFETITDVTKLLRDRGFSNSEANNVVFALKKFTSEKAPRNEDQDSARNEKPRNEAVKKLIAEMEKTKETLKS